jgi:uncharacterized protein YxjI
MEIEHDRDTVATIKKALITPLGDRFAIELAPGQEDALILAAVVCIDEMARR